MMRAEEIVTERGEAGRLGELYAAHAPYAGRLAYLLTGEHPLAEDLVQEAFVRMFGRFRDIRQPEAFRAYLRRTIVNLVRSHFRRRRVERDYLEREGGRAEPVVDAEPGHRDELWSALRTLSPRQRAAVVLRFYEDLSEARTAEALGCPIGTVKSLTSRGLDRLRSSLSEGE